MSVEKFDISVKESVLTDLQKRLSNTRWPIDYANDNWEYGTNLNYLKELIEYWINDYDWRKHEKEMNSFNHYKTSIENVPIHFIHEKGKGPNPMPLIMSHGWPWTFWDYNKVIRPLCDPVSYGGKPEDAFDVVVPSLPGYGFSTPLTVPGINFWRTADLWVKLMQDELGYDKFGVQGADWGSSISGQLGHKYADSVIGVHLHFMIDLTYDHSLIVDDDFSEEEKCWIAENNAFNASEAAYNFLHQTKPQSLAYGFNDSPAGLCAWLLEKRRRWSDCDGDVEKRFTKDELLTSIMIYWATQSFGTSARYYAEQSRNPWKPYHDLKPVVQAPTGIAVFPKDIFKCPRKWAEKYYNLHRWTVMPSGGHFGPMEEPEKLVHEIREFFRPLR